MTTLIAKKLTLKQVHELLHFEEHFDGSFTPWLSWSL
jgi:hypothetical protein